MYGRVVTIEVELLFLTNVKYFIENFLIFAHLSFSDI